MCERECDEVEGEQRSTPENEREKYSMTTISDMTELRLQLGVSLH